MNYEVNYEVLCKGYNGDNDETDGLVLWVKLEEHQLSYFTDQCNAHGADFSEMLFEPQEAELDFDLSLPKERIGFETALARAAARADMKEEPRPALGKDYSEVDAATRASDKAFVALLGDPEKERLDRAERLKLKINENLRVSEALGAHRALQFLFELMAHMGKSQTEEQREYVAFLAVQLEEWLKKEYPL